MTAKLQAIGVAGLVLVAMVVGGAALSYEQVPEGHQGVTLEWGAVNGENLESGAHWKIPIAQSVQPVEIRPRTYTMSDKQGEGEKANRADAVTVKTINGSSVDVELTVRYRIKQDQTDQFVAEWNNEEQMEKRLIRPTVRSVLRDEASSLQTTGPNSIYTQEGRQALEATATEALNEEFEGQPIVLEAVQIRNIDLPDEIDQTLDEKEQAKQQVEVEKEKVKQEKAKAEQEIVRAEADAKAIEIRGEALEDNKVVLQQQYIEALKEGNTIYVPTETGGITLTKEADNSTAEGS